MRKTLRAVQVLNINNQSVLADTCFVAESFFDRLKGLIGTSSLEQGQGLLLRPCNDIHMWFMSIPVDVVFLHFERKIDNSSIYRVTSFKQNIHPWKLFPVRDRHASETLELPVDTISRCHLRVGDELCIN